MKLPSIQGLRFLGFLMIFLNHSYWLFAKNKWFDFGARGVEIFFVLSGFLMAYHYGNKEVAYDLKSSIRYMLRKEKNFINYISLPSLLWVHISCICGRLLDGIIHMEGRHFIGTLF